MPDLSIVLQGTDFGSRATYRDCMSVLLSAPEDGVSEQVILRAVPHNDEAFARHAEEARRRMAPSDPDALAALLRARYPSVRIVAQSSLAAFGVGIVWYAYRDGIAVPPEQNERASKPTLEREAS